MKKNGIRNLGVFSTLLLFITCSVSSQEISVKVFPELQLQRIKSIGANYCQVRLTNSAYDAIGEETLRQFRPENVRVAVPLKVRGADYSVYKGAKLVEQPLVISLLEFMKRMKNEFGVKSFTVSTWDVPDELVVDPTVGRARVLKPESYDEALDLIVGFLLKAKKDYGVEVDYFSFNESEKGIAVIFSPEATIAFIKKAGKRFREEGLKTSFLLSDASTPKVSYEFATMIMADSTIWKFLGPLSFHSWGAERMSNTEYERVAALGKALNRPVWCTELGHDGSAHRIKGVFETWDYGFRFAKISSRVMKYTQAEVTMYWTWQNDYPIMSTDLKTNYPSYYATRHFTDYLNTGTQIVNSLSSDPELFVICGIHENETRVIQLINTKKVPVKVNIQGFDSKSIEMVTTTESINWEENKKIKPAKKGIIKLDLKSESINTLILK
jgi:hypothetical protein